MGRLFLLSRPTPISIRDQVLRGVMLVERLDERNDFAVPRDVDYDLVVVGAGSAGVAAAMRASELGVKTLVIEAGPTPFSLQRRTRSRLLDPVQYDWPVDHYDVGCMPWPGAGPSPLPLKKGFSSTLALDWLKLFNAELASRPNLLTYLPSTSLTGIHWARRWRGKRLMAAVTARATFTCTVIIGAAETKRERVEIVGSSGQMYRSIDFWASDDLIRTRRADLRVLVSGFGDGALQDYFRAVTGWDDIGRFIRDLRLPDHLLRRIQSAEDRAHRGRVWAADDSLGADHEEPWLQHLEDVHEAVVTDAMAIAGVPGRIAAAIKGAMPTVHLVCRGRRMGAYYGLNRFITLLLRRYLNESGLGETVFPQCEIDDISVPHPASHACGIPGRETDCFDREHEVRFKVANGAGRSTRRPPDGVYDVVLVRHGVDRASPPPLRRRLPFTRQILPYGIP